MKGGGGKMILKEHFKNMDVTEHVKATMKNKTDKKHVYDVTELVKQTFNKNQFEPAIQNVIINYCFQVEEKVFPPTIEEVAERWKRLNITTLDKAIQQAKAEYEIVNTFRLNLITMGMVEGYFLED
jgi:replication initiation and membrane attachment protein DnaB